MKIYKKDKLQRTVDSYNKKIEKEESNRIKITTKKFIGGLVIGYFLGSIVTWFLFANWILVMLK